MANVRCPMCSKVNPPDAEECAFCGARLKLALTSPSASPQGSISNESAGKPEGDEPDWLRQIRQDSSGSTVPGISIDGSDQEDARQPVEDVNDVPDWLARIRERSRDETDAPLAPAAPAESSSPQESQPADKMDWMSQFAGWESGAREGASTVDQAAAAGPAAGEEDLSWLSSFNQEKEQSTGDNHLSDPGQGRVSSGFGLTGFLSSLEEKAEETAPQADAPSCRHVPANIDWNETTTVSDQATTGEPAAPADDLPAWLNGPAPETAPDDALFPEETDSLTESLFADADDNDWLKRFNAPSSEETVPAAAASIEAVEEAPGIPEWLQGESFGVEASETTAGEGDLLEWLSRDSGAEVGASAQVETHPDVEEPPAVVEQPLSALPVVEESADEVSPFAEPVLPEWLAASQDQDLFSQDEGSQPLETGRSEEAESGAAEPTLPVWMINEAEPPAEPSQAAPDEIFAAQEMAQPAALLSGQPEMAAGAEEGIPEWLSDFSQADEKAPSAQPIEDTQPTWLVGISAQESADKERSSRQAAEQVPQNAGAEAGPEPFIDENVPEWLRDFNSRQPSSESSSVPALIDMDETRDAAGSGDADQPFSVDLPDWLSEDSTPAPVETDELAAEPAGEELARADLPEWVKEMRPIESVLGSESSTALESDQRVEKAGPLAGMRGVLPAEEMVTHYRKLPVYSVKLRVTEKQRSHGSLLDTILSQETQALALPPQRSHTPRLILRILVALILLSVMLLPRLLQLDALVLPLSSPGLAPDEMQDLFDSIEGSVSQDSAPVLLAVDYEPGLSGEMRLSAVPVVAHLIARNARIVVLSTVPSGPALAQRLIVDAAADQENYDLDERTVNLGYLPGGTISLLEFARQPQLAAPVTLSGEFAWDKAAVSGVSDLQSFSQIIVLTDSPETGRAWVEQVKPFMGAVPLLMVSSAQAAPMLEPYVQSGQVQGLVSGMLGGIMYGQQTGIANNPAAAHFASYQYGVLLAFGLVLTGAIISGGRALLRRRTKDEE